ncbi:MAG: hypothetical protein AB8B52_01535 [Winogradskyella sp.]|uniref:hypothetical protein n=1 Tax=Winogradskyella sp. TaxID=1883156 RepID=UPI00385E2DBA
MKSKLHFGLIVVLLTFLVTFLEQSTLPNQQIVVQFTASVNNSEKTENAIEAIQEQLEGIGATQIKIGQQNHGQYTITYYSASNIEDIQNILFNVNDFKIDDETSNNQSDHFPENQSLKDYELNISEIKTSTSVSWDVEGTQVAEINQKTDHSNTLKVNTSASQPSTKKNNATISNAILVKHNVAIVRDYHAYQIPEVRAGPLA